ncbi:MAG: hypothetical protein ACLUE7_05035 [Lachnospirales bacterium]
MDTLLLSRKFNKDCAKHNLNYLTKHFNIKLDHAHRAYYDALWRRVHYTRLYSVDITIP